MSFHLQKWAKSVFLKRPFWEINWVPKEELTRLQFLSLFIHITFSVAVSLRKCLETLPGLTQKPFHIYEDGLFSLFMVALILPPAPIPAPPPLRVKLLVMFRLLGFAPFGADAPTFYFLFLSSFLPLKLKGLNRPAPLVWWCFQFPLIPTQALAIALRSSLWVGQCCLS